MPFDPMPASVRPVESKVGARGEQTIDLDQILHGAHFGGEHDLVGREPKLNRPLGADQSRLPSPLASRAASLGSGSFAFSSIRRVSRSWSRLPQFTPMRTGLSYLDCDLDDRRKLPVALGLEADIAGIDAVFGERLRASGMLGEQRVAVIMKVADERHVEPTRIEPLADMRHRGGGLIPVHGDAHEFGAGAGKGGDLRHGGIDMGGVGVGHGLHHDGRGPADNNATNVDRH